MSAAGVAAAMLVGWTVWWLGPRPPRRRVRRLGAPVPRTSRRGLTPAERTDARGGGAEPVAVVARVASLVRAGAAPGDAWQQTCGVEVDDLGVPDGAHLAARWGGAPGGRRRGAGWARRAGGRDAAVAARSRAAAVVAGSALAVELGAPTATVLDVIGAALVAEAEARDERDAAFAGPRATVRLLLCLPLVGVLLGAALGASPWGTLLGGGVGSAALLLGVGFLGAGWWWTRRLVARARAEGSPP
ncbi:type II secretion system F family protein [Cellulomonas sp. PhB143]|uniref:type II secretion system F family protein n=1 Tax=Cellulomonas sp. PhB143 TaxID=2485186 RepID=UPI001F39466A|nr:hypothetical protein [Cellulomonas sp. PhB143]